MENSLFREMMVPKFVRIRASLFSWKFSLFTLMLKQYSLLYCKVCWTLFHPSKLGQMLRQESLEQEQADVKLAVQLFIYHVFQRKKLGYRWPSYMKTKENIWVLLYIIVMQWVLWIIFWKMFDICHLSTHWIFSLGLEDLIGRSCPYVCQSVCHKFSNF